MSDEKVLNVINLKRYLERLKEYLVGLNLKRRRMARVKMIIGHLTNNWKNFLNSLVCKLHKYITNKLLLQEEIKALNELAIYKKEEHDKKKLDNEKKK